MKGKLFWGAIGLIVVAVVAGQALQTLGLSTLQSVPAGSGQPTGGLTCPDGSILTTQQAEAWRRAGFDPCQQTAFDRDTTGTEPKSPPTSIPQQPVSDSLPWYVWVIGAIVAYVIATVFAFKFIFK